MYKITYLNKNNRFKVTEIYFNTYEQAVAWGQNNLSNFSNDVIVLA
jgi:hypothetical protein